MRSWIIDQFEFDEPLTEERLEINAAALANFPFPNVLAFIKATAGGQANLASLGPPIPFSESMAYGKVRGYISRFSGLELPNPCSWPTYVLADGPDEWHLVLCGPNQFISYAWSTSA